MDTLKKLDKEFLFNKYKKIKPDFEKMTYPEKLLFWGEHCDLNISELVTGKHEIIISIYPNSKKERILYNEWQLNHIHKVAEQPEIKKTKNEVFQYLSLEKLKKRFLEEYEIALEKRECVNTEIEEIEKLLNRTFFNGLAKEIFTLYQRGKQKSIDLTKNYTINDIIAIKTGENAALFLKFLNDLELKVHEQIASKKPVKKSPKIAKLWKGNKTDSIKKFRELLLEYDLIDEIDENEFTNHFTGKTCEVMINWKDEQTVFIRLFDEINFVFNESHLFGINELPSPKELSKHFLMQWRETTSKKLRGTRCSIKGTQIKKEQIITKIKQSLKKYFPDCR